MCAQYTILMNEMKSLRNEIFVARSDLSMRNFIFGMVLSDETNNV